MPLKRSRPRTEAKIQAAVLDLLADEGCCALGVNAVAHRAGADKVLIYRYFGDLYGLLQTVAESREWLPDVDDVIHEAGSANGAASLRNACNRISQHIETDRPGRQILAWRRAEKNPLTSHFSEAWSRFWDELAGRFSEGLDYEGRKAWKDACALAALMVEAELCGEGLAADCFDRIGNGLDLGTLDTVEAYAGTTEDDHLPTNLL